MEDLGKIARSAEDQFSSLQTQISSSHLNLKYVILGVIVIFAIAVITITGSSFGLCKTIPLGRLCSMGPWYRSMMTVSSVLALIFWVGYYFNLTKQTDYLASSQVKKFFPSAVQSELTSLQNNSKLLLILANFFSLPIYFLFLSIFVGLFTNK